MLSTIGMNTSCAQCRTYMVDAAAMSVRAMLRTLTRASTAAGASRSFLTWETRALVTSGSHGLRNESGAGLQRLVDGDTGLGAFSGGDDDELHVARGVADDVDARHAGLAEQVGLDGALAGELAAETLRQPALLALARRDEHRLAVQATAVGQLEMPGPPIFVH